MIPLVFARSPNICIFQIPKCLSLCFGPKNPIPATDLETSAQFLGGGFCFFPPANPFPYILRLIPYPSSLIARNNNKNLCAADEEELRGKLLRAAAINPKIGGGETKSVGMKSIEILHPPGAQKSKNIFFDFFELNNKKFFFDFFELNIVIIKIFFSIFLS